MVGFQHYGLTELGCNSAWYIIKNAILFNTGYEESSLGLLLDVLFYLIPLGYVYFLFRRQLWWKLGGDIVRYPQFEN